MRKRFLISKMWLVLVTIAALGISYSAAQAHERRDVGDYNMVVGFEVEPAYEGIKNAAGLRVTRKSEEVDVSADGAVFESPDLNPGETFTFNVSEELEGKTIPFHNDLYPEATGTVEVTDSAELSGTVNIDVMGDNFDPADIAIKGSTTLVFTNVTDTVQTVDSGVRSVADDPGGSSDQESSPAALPEAITGLESALQVEVTHVPSNISKVMPLRDVYNDPGHYVADFVPTAPGVYQFRFFGTIEGAEVNETFVSEGGGGGFGDVESVSNIQFPERQPAVRDMESAVKGAQSTAEESQDTASRASTMAIVGIVLGVVGTVIGGAGWLVGLRRK